MKKNFRSLIATMMVLSLVLSCSAVTAFAETKSKTGTEAETFPVTLSYTRSTAENPDPENPDNPGGDDTKVDVINIEIAFDNLEFAYEADSIKWDPNSMMYVVTLKNTKIEKGIKVTNKSNVEIGVTPSFNNEGTSGIPIGTQFNLIRVSDEANIAAADNRYGSRDLMVTTSGDYRQILGIAENNETAYKAFFTARTHTGGTEQAGDVSPDQEEFSRVCTKFVLNFDVVNSNAATNPDSGSGDSSSGSEHTGGGSMS